MSTIKYSIEFLSDWHCGSGMSAGADVDTLCIKDADGLPFVPGKTLKGLLSEAFDIICSGDSESHKTLFGAEGEKQGACYFSNAVIQDAVGSKIVSQNSQSILFRKLSATAIDDNGEAIEHSLRKTEVSVPITVYGEIADIPDAAAQEKIQKCMAFIKRLGVNRNRGLGRCVITETQS